MFTVTDLVAESEGSSDGRMEIVFLSTGQIETFML